MNLQYLKYAIEVDRAGSISKAAENLYMNQPNLSKAIKELESATGVTLFTRSTKGVSATTQEGRVFIEYAKSILGQFEEMKSYFQKPRSRGFRLAVPRAAYIAEAFAAFVDKLGDKDEYSLTFQETQSLQVIESVVDGFDLGILRYRTRYERYFLSLLRERELEYRELLSGDSVVLMGRANPLAGHDTLTSADLVCQIEIVNDDFAVPRHISTGRPDFEGVSENRRHVYVYGRGSQLELLSKSPATFLWASPLPPDTLARHGLVQKSCRGDGHSFKDMLIHRSGHTAGALEQAFLEHLEQTRQMILAGSVCT